MQVRARSAPRLLGAAAQELRKQIVALREVPVSRLALIRMAALGGVIAIVAGVRRRPLRPRGVDLAGVEAPPLLRVGKQIIGPADLLEPLLRLLVARIEIRVQLLGQLSISRANLVSRGGLGDSEGFVRVFHTRNPSRARPVSLSRSIGAVSRRPCGAPESGAKDQDRGDSVAFMRALNRLAILRPLWQ